MKRKKILKLFIIVFATIIFISLSIYKFYPHKINFEKLSNDLEVRINSFSGTSAILIKDLNGRWEFLHNEKLLFPSASIVKIPLMAVCFIADKEGYISLDERVVLKNRHKVSGSGVLKGLPAGKIFTLRELISLMISQSDNTATNMLIDRLGFDYINSSFKELGLKDTNLSRKMMDFRKRRNGIENYTTANDISYVLEKIYRNEILNNAISQECLNLLRIQKVRDRIPALLPENAEIAHKTGLERGICHDGGIVFTKNGDFLICVLTRHNNRTSRLAKKFIAQIAFLTYNCYNHEDK